MLLVAWARSIESQTLFKDGFLVIQIKLIL